MTENDLARFPSLARARNAFANLPPLEVSYISTLHESHPYIGGLDSTEKAMAILLAHRNPDQLSSQIRGLFGQTEANWSAAVTEVLGLSALDHEGLLDRVGWPPAFPGDTPPFEGTMFDVRGNNNVIAFDVKNAANVGLRLLDQTFTPIVEEWRTRTQLPPAEIEYDTTGAITLEILGRERIAMVRDFTRQLNTHTTFPELPLRLYAGVAAAFLVTIRAATGSALNVHVAGTTARARSIANVVRGHVTAKAAQAVQHGGVFIIVYVRPPSCGTADVTPRALELALPMLESDPELLAAGGVNRWLGTIMLDWTRPTSSPPSRHGTLRLAANWPAGSSVNTLSESLRLTPWP